MVLEKTPESPLDCKEVQPVHPKGDQSWVFIGRTGAEAETSTLATSCEVLTHLKRHWCWGRLKAGGEGNNSRQDGWVASPTRWRWSLSRLWEMVKDREAWCAAGQGVTERQTWVRSWTPGREAGKGWNTEPELCWRCQHVPCLQALPSLTILMTSRCQHIYFCSAPACAWLEIPGNHLL